VETVEPEAILSQSAKGRGLNSPAEWRCGSKANVIDKYHYYIGSTFRSFNMERNWLRRVSSIHLCNWWSRWGFNWQNGPVKLFST
jgi:hypothetical protein